MAKLIACLSGIWPRPLKARLSWLKRKKFTVGTGVEVKPSTGPVDAVPGEICAVERPPETRPAQ